jgi:NADH dehydrogenase [ubiquinone] 1 alpha subcomplex assembly factor 7
VTALFDLIAKRIRRRGPLSVAEYMELALAHPQHGYYRTRDPLGRQGDFITAPEISQIFGELIGLWCADTWERMGRPDPVLLVELGPGRGTLIADALRAAEVRPAFRRACRIHLVEMSPVLRAAQKTTLGDTPSWHETPETLPEGPPLLVIANEFFDALPAHQFLRTEKGWRERVVRLDASGDGLSFGLAERPTKAQVLIPSRLDEAPVGTHWEVSPTALVIAGQLARRIAHHGGAALAIDYGHVLGGTGETLQAVRGHQRHEPLAEPGTADLTTHVDFAALADAAATAGAVCHGPVTQRAFLRALGLELRAAALVKAASPAQAPLVESGARRLIEPGGMGTLFKALAIAHPNLSDLAGFS